MALGGMNIDDSASYCAAACWADDIDNEVQGHVSFLSLEGERRDTQKGPLKIVMLRGRTGALRWRLNELDIAALPCEFVETVGSNIPSIHKGRPPSALC
jgi:hypothetical protein